MRGWGPWALVGALLGAVAGIALDALVDPAGDRVNQAFEQGYREGFVLRYVALGALGSVLAERLWRERRGSRRGRPSALLAAGLLVVVTVAVVPVALSESPEERERDDFRAGFVDGCTDSSSREGLTRPEAERYCSCFYDSLSRGRDRRELTALLARTRAALEGGRRPPRIALLAGSHCRRRVGI